MKSSTSIVLAISVLILSTLACEQAGEILTPEEATQRAQTAIDVVEAETPNPELDDTEIQIGETVRFVTNEFLVLLKREPGAALIAVQTDRGATGTVIGTALYEGEVWYEVEIGSGSGWLPAPKVEAVGVVEAEYEIGDIVYLRGPQDEVKVQTNPGSGNPFSRSEPVGAEVSIVKKTVVEDKNWYQVAAPGGLGWVTGEFLTSQKPEAE
ncbi:MAG: hypothetical protein P1P76_00980 [Anaerolineales bacterium]|nr:hypothetical protein [Anaerolineales bacterium]